MARRGRVFFYLAFIIIILMVGAVVVLRFMGNSNPAAPAPGADTPPPPVETVEVLVITQQVGRGDLIRAEVIQAKTMPREFLIQGQFTGDQQAEVIGRQAFVELKPGHILSSSDLVAANDQLSSVGSVAALAIPKGMVAVSIPISQLSAVSYAPQAGDHVNVIVTLEFVDLDTDFQSRLPNFVGKLYPPNQPPDLVTPISEYAEPAIAGRAEVNPVTGNTLYIQPGGTPRGRMASQTLLQDAVVLRMGNFDLPTAATTPADQGNAPIEGEPPVAEPGGDANAAQEETGFPDVVTLVVSPQDAVTLNYLVNAKALLTMALRSAGDNQRIQTEAVTLQFLLDQYRIPVPVKLPYGMEPIAEPRPTPVPVQ
jgi:pilus assembly protein CpaB